MNRLNAPPSYSLSCEIDNIRHAPPPYRHTSRSNDLGASHQPDVFATQWTRNIPKGRIENMKRWLIELVALNLEADFDALSPALGPDTSNYWDRHKRHTCNEAKSNARDGTILSEGNQDTLRYSTRKVQKVHRNIKQDQKPDAMDAWVVCIVFNEQSREIDPLCEEFVMDLLGWYSECCAVSTSQIDTCREPWESEEDIPDSLIGLHVTYMRNFKRLIIRISPNAKVKAILESALDNCRLEERFEKIESRTYYAPIRARYSGLSRVLEQCQQMTPD
jgi:hypothetical protein